MRIVYVCTLPGAGPVAHLRSLAPSVVRGGHDVLVVCADERVATAFRSAGVEAVAAPLTHKLDMAGARRLRPLLRHADVVHTHDRRAGLLARPLARLAGAAAVHTYHGLPHEIAPLAGRPEAPLPGVSRVRRAWLVHGYLRVEAVLSRLGLVVVPSRTVADFLIAHGLSAGRVRVVANGVAPTRSEPGSARRPLVVGTSGILEHRKGVDVLLEAAARVEAPVRVEIIGDGSLRHELEDQARRLGVDARFSGVVDDVPTRLEQLDVFVLASRDENLPIAALEAMAAALPVVATRVGGVPELVVDGETGLLVEPDDPAALAAAIERLATDERLRRGLAAHGAERLRERFSAEEMTRRMLVVYHEAVRGHRSRRAVTLGGEAK